MILKGQTIKLKVDEQVIAKSTGCTVNVNMATEDVSSKDDEESEFDNPDATVMSWDCQNESFVADLASMVALMNKFKSKQFVSVEVNDPNGVTDMNGYAIITGISVSAPAQDNATMTLSLTGYEHLVTN